MARNATHDDGAKVSPQGEKGERMSKKLLPCPFCGGDAEIERMGTRRQSCQVACTNCGARHESPDQNEHSGDSWNRRAALDGEWQSERPSPGMWWVAIAPEKRSDLSFWSGTDPIKDVWAAKSGEVFQGNTGLSDELLTGALWQRRTVPADPFKRGGE